MEHEELLYQAWVADICELAPEAGEALWTSEFDLLLTAWAEPHRKYHNVQHLVEMLAALQVLSGQMTQQQARIARLAAWFHDLEYNPRAAAGSNEHRSATKARDHLHRLGVDDHVIDAVEALILQTVSHDSAASHAAVSAELSAAFNDADLWILSAPADRYNEYAAAVRAEYRHVPDDLFAAGRIAIMSALVDKASLYATAHGQAHWETSARQNVGTELRRLR